MTPFYSNRLPVVLFLAALAGCSSTNTSGTDSPDSPDSSTDSPDSSPDSPASCLPDCPASRDYDALSYELTGRFDWTSKRLSASEHIVIKLGQTASEAVEFDSAVNVTSVRAGTHDLAYLADAANSTLRVDLTPVDSLTSPIELTVDFDTAGSESLFARSSRDADPATSRVVYTHSEPDLGKSWLVANHRPADRATFAIELTVGADEDVVSNGARIKDEKRGDSRVVRYEMNKPIPTYLMAFAAGQLDHTERAGGRVPLSVWYRHGLLLDPQETLENMGQALSTFESLLGPYPWDRYSVVYLPGFSGGSEHTEIVFQDEVTGQAAVDEVLLAHELSHQWLGNWVTVQTWDDLWIKEGMATLLENEPSRQTRDTEGKGRFFGIERYFENTDAVRDHALKATDKYTSGPYTRAGWLLGQIRAHVGEAPFWSAVRKTLADHALGSIDSETFVRTFAPALDEKSITRVLASLDEKSGPTIRSESAPGEKGTEVTVTLTDRAGTLLAPFEITVVDAEGHATTTPVAPGKPLTITVPTGGYLAPDERDVHPFDIEGLKPALLLPSSPAALAAFETRSAAHQERALANGTLPVTASAFGAFHQTLDSPRAQLSADLAACEMFASSADWQPAVTPFLKSPPITAYDEGYSSCDVEVAATLFGAEFAGLNAHVDAKSAKRLAYLAGFDFGPAKDYELMSPLAASAPSLQLRELAITRLAGQTSSAEIPPADVPKWKEFFRSRLAEATSDFHLMLVWQGVSGLSDEGALTLVAQKLKAVPASESSQLAIVCDAYEIAQTHPGAWSAFQEAGKPWNLEPLAMAAVQDPSACQN